MVQRKVVRIALPAAIAVLAFLHAHAIGGLIDRTGEAPASIAPFAEARAAAARASGEPIDLEYLIRIATEENGKLVSVRAVEGDDR